jgi:signal transduction histidine kinase
MIKVCQHSPKLVKVLVIDNGCGIPTDKLELIKTPFYQIVKSDTRPTSGLGIGLAICEKILAGHGTSLTIESRENHGTTCSFCLKIATEN